MSLSIGKFIFQQLSGVTTQVNALVLPQDVTKPYIVYHRMSTAPDYTSSGTAFDVTQVQVDVVSDSYVRSIELAEQVRAIFEYRNFVFGNLNINCGALVSADEIAFESKDAIGYVQTTVFEFQTQTS
jgi:hypothetical protein